LQGPFLLFLSYLSSVQEASIDCSEAEWECISIEFEIFDSTTQIYNEIEVTLTETYLNYGQVLDSCIELIGNILKFDYQIYECDVYYPEHLSN
jgi:hypothetical protein